MSSQEPADQPSPPTSQDSQHEPLHGRGVLPADPPTIRRDERHAYLHTDLDDDSDGSEIIYGGSDAREPYPSNLPYSRAVFDVEEDAGISAAEVNHEAPTNEDNSGQSAIEDDSGQSTVATSVEEAGEQPVQACAAEDESGASLVAEDFGPSTIDEDSGSSSVQNDSGVSFVAEDAVSITAEEDSGPSSVRDDSGAPTVETDIKEASALSIEETAVENEATRPVIVENAGSSTVGDNSGAPGEVRNVYPPEPSSCAYAESPEIPRAAGQVPLPGHKDIKQPVEPIITQGHPGRPLKTVELEDERQSRHGYEESVRPRTFAPQVIQPGQGRYSHQSENRDHGHRFPEGQRQSYSPGPAHPDPIQIPIPQRTDRVDTLQEQPTNKPTEPEEVDQNLEMDELPSVKQKIYCKDI
jgi:hypothetical protein